MWKMIFSLWLPPILLALVAAARAASGKKLVTARERRVVFGGSPHATPSLWFWIAVATLAGGFFVLGVVQAVILLNFDIVWAVLAPLLTGILAILLLLVLFRIRLFHRAEPRRVGSSSRGRERAAYSPDF